MQTTYINLKETAKLIREALKKNFKGVKFSVRGESYSGGASINVNWSEGPTVAAVDAIVKRFEGAKFDGMTDCKDYVSELVVSAEGELKRNHYASDYVFTKREITPETRAAVLAQFCQKWGIQNPGLDKWGNFPYPLADSRGYDLTKRLADMMASLDLRAGVSEALELSAILEKI